MIRDLATRPYFLVETEHLTPMAFPLWADRLQSTLVAGDAATRLAEMLTELNHAVAGTKPPPPVQPDEAPKKRHYELKPVRRRHGS